MKLLITFSYLITLLSLVSSCEKFENNIEGTYIKVPSINTIDSLFIYSDSLQPTQIHERKVFKYKQVLYSKKTNKLLLINNGTWWLDGEKIELMNFYFDADNNSNEHSFYKGAIENSVILFSTEMDGENIIVEKGVFNQKTN